VIPGAVRVKAYPAVESLGMVWVWPGDPECVDPDLLPKFPWFERPGFVSRHLRMHFEAPFDLIVDNLMDLTHVHFVHSILGADTLVHESEPMQVWDSEGHVRYRRDLRQGPFASRGIHMEISGEFIPPSAVYTANVPKRDGTDEVPELPMSQVIHCLTPRTAASTSYIALKSWNLLAKPHEIAAVEHQMRVTLTEDKEIVEAQYRNRVDSADDAEEKLIRADRAAVMARRAYDRMLTRETSASSGSGT
jgi:phenylpropionate dioxygenase-like ring-hydroxylating dioxygenase large terminal subunit